MRPATLEGDWNRLYSEFPDVEVSARAAHVTGVEPNPAMRAVAEARAAVGAARNVTFVDGSAQAIPADDESADAVVAITASFWPAEEVVPRFVDEAMRVLRPGGAVASLQTHPDWHGGEFRDIAAGAIPAYERAVDALLRPAGFGHHDFETVQDYGTTAQAVALYGFIFGSRAIERLRKRRQTTIRWRWRLYRRERATSMPTSGRGCGTPHVARANAPSAPAGRVPRGTERL